MVITQEKFKESFARLPFTIREYLMGDELTEIVQSIGTNYGLHIDTVGALDREVSNMLLGLENPQEFINELRSIGIPAGSIAPMVQELNQKVFMPLHQKMQEPGADRDPGAEDEEAMQEVAQNMGIQASAAADTESVPYSVVPGPVAPVLASVPSYTPPAQAPIYQAPVYVPPPVLTPQQAPTTPMPPQNLPVQNPPTIQNVFPRPSAALQQGSVSSENRDELHKVMKEYGIDPYREPPE